MLTFDITFHGPFHVGTGTPAAGVDSTVDPDALIPGTSLKGLMRAEAAHRLGVGTSLVNQIFGDRLPDDGQPGGFRTFSASPWHWSRATLATYELGRHARIQVGDRGAVKRGSLMIGQQVWCRTATFEVDQLLPLAPDHARNHTLVLRAAARSITSIGAHATRGSGWVSIDERDTAHAWTSADTQALIALRGAS